MQEVAFPALSELVRGNSGDLKRIYYRFHLVIAAVAYFGAGVLMMSANNLIALIYDIRYHQAGWMLQILAIALLSLPLGVALRCFVIMGMPERLFQFGAIRLGSLVIGILGGFYFFGLIGAVWGISLSFFASAPVTIYYQIKHNIFDLFREMLALLVIPVGLTVGLVLNLAIGHR
jgi:hypothetical protein